jgi:hypothetical protein
MRHVDGALTTRLRYTKMLADAERASKNDETAGPKASARRNGGDEQPGARRRGHTAWRLSSGRAPARSSTDKLNARGG